MQECPYEKARKAVPRRVRGSNFLIRVICCEKPEYQKIGLCGAVFGAVPCAAHADGPDSANWQHAAPDAYSGAFVRPCLRLAVRCSGGLCCAAAALGPVRDASGVSGGYCDGL